MSPKHKNDNNQQGRKNKIVAFALLVIVVVFLSLTIYQRANQASSAEVITLASPLQTDTPTPLALDQNNATPVCFWNWATNHVTPEQLEALQDALDNAGIADYQVIASAYGEDQICQRDGETVSSSFYLMDITPTITLTVDSETLADSTTLGAQVRQIVTALQASEALPKINRLEITFTDETDSIRWIATYNEATQAITNDASDDDLFALGVQT